MHSRSVLRDGPCDRRVSVGGQGFGETPTNGLGALGTPAPLGLLGRVVRSSWAFLARSTRTDIHGPHCYRDGE